MNRLSLTIFTSTLALIALTWSGCSKSSVSLEQVPATAGYVIVMNAADTDNSPLNLLPAEIASQITLLDGCLDLNHLICYKVADAHQPFAMLTVTDPDMLHSSLKQSGWNKRNIAGEDAWVPSGNREFMPCLIEYGDGLWFLPTRKDIGAWRQSLKDAEKSNLAENTTISDLLVQGEMFKAWIFPAYLGMDSSQPPVEVIGKSEPKDNRLLITAVSPSTDPSGQRPLPLTAMFAPLPREGNTFMDYMPSDPSLVFVVGMTGSIGWDALIDQLGPQLGTQNQGMLQSLLPYLSDLAGPFAVGVGPLDINVLTSDRIEDQRLIIYATLKDNRAADAVNEINGNLRAKGLHPEPRPDGIYAFALDGVTYRYTARGNAFIFALNREIDQPAGNGPEVRQIPSEATMAGWLTLPPVDGLSGAASFTLTPGCGTVTLSANGPQVLKCFADYFGALDKVNAVTVDDENYYDDY